jgi:hypothetical protein
MSDDDFLKAARKQEQAVLAKLRQTELYKKLEAVRAAIEAFKNDEQASKSNGTAHRDRPRLSPEAIEAHVARGTKTATIIQGAAHHLRSTRKRATSGEITRALVQVGIVAAGTSSKLISSYLSNSDLFDNDQRAGGYGLAEWKGAG